MNRKANKFHENKECGFQSQSQKLETLNDCQSQFYEEIGNKFFTWNFSTLQNFNAWGSSLFVDFPSLSDIISSTLFQAGSLFAACNRNWI